MIGYVTVGTDDLPRAAAFFDTLLAGIGARRIMESDRFIAWGRGQGCGLAAMRPFDGDPASVGNGTMVALVADSRETVDRVHAKALELGGKDEGAPGPRSGIPGIHAGYFRDLDGNKFNIYPLPPPA